MFKCSPNPVKNAVSISNNAIINEVSFVSTNGKTLLKKQINSNSAEIDLSNFSKGMYFLKIKSEGQEKTLKLIKE